MACNPTVLIKGADGIERPSIHYVYLYNKFLLQTNDETTAEQLADKHYREGVHWLQSLDSIGRKPAGYVEHKGDRAGQNTGGELLKGWEGRKRGIYTEDDAILAKKSLSRVFDNVYYEPDGYGSYNVLVPSPKGIKVNEMIGSGIEHDLKNAYQGEAIPGRQLTLFMGLDPIAALFDIEADLNGKVAPGPEPQISSLENDIALYFKNHEESFRKSLKELFAKTTKTINVLSRSIPKEELVMLKRLKDRLEDPKVLGEVTTYANYLKETQMLIKGFVEYGRTIVNKPNNPDKLKQLDKLNSIASSYEDVFNDVYKDWSVVAASNTAKQVISDINNGIKELKTLYSLSVESEVTKIVSQNVSTQVAEVQKDLQKQLDFYKKRLDDYKTSPKKDLLAQNFVEKKIAEIEKLMANKDYSEKIVSDFLLGNRKDLGFFTQFVAPAAVDDPVIGAVVNMFNNALTSLRATFIPVTTLYSDQFEQFLKVTGRTRGNNKELYKGLVTPVKIHYYDATTQKIEEREYLSFVNKFEASWYTDISMFDAREREARENNDLDKAEAIKKEKKEFLYKYAEQPYTQDWYDDYKILDEAPDTPEGPGAETSRKRILNEIKAINEKSVNDENDLILLDSLWKEWRMLASPVNAQGVPKTGQELKVANTIRKFNKIHREKYSFELTDKGRERFNAEKDRIQEALRLKALTPQEYEDWVKQNLRTFISPEFYEKQRSIYNQINAILSKIPETVLKRKVDTGDFWEIIKAVVNNYRDENGVIDGTAVNAELAKKIQEKEQELYDLKQNLDTLSGLTKIQSRRLSDLYAKMDVQGLNASEQDDFETLSQLKEAKKSAIDQYITEMDRLMIKSLYAELSSIQSTSLTDYYKETKAQVGEDSQWFRDNHILKERLVFDEESGDYFEEEYWDPIYIWKHTAPNEKHPDYNKYVLRNEPAFKYWDRVVHDQYLNKNFRESVTGTPNAREILPDGSSNPYISKEYNNLKSSTDTVNRGIFSYLTFLTDRYLDSQSKVPAGNRLGYLIPGIRKGRFERLTESNNNVYTKIKDYFTSGIKESFTLTEKDIDSGLANLKGEELQIVPVQFSTKLDSNDVSLSLTENVLKYEFGASKYRYLKDNIEPVTNALLNTLEANKPATGRVDAVLKGLGINRFIKAGGDSTRLRIAKHLIHSFVNNVSSDDVLIGNVSGTKAVGALLGYSSFTMQALNMTVQVVNGVSGNLQNMIEAHAGDDYNVTDLKDAKKVIYSNAKNFYEDRLKVGKKSKISQILQLFNVSSDDLTGNYGAEADRSALKWWLKDTKFLYWIKDYTEFEVSATLGLAMLNHKKVKQGNTEIKLIDAFELDSNGNIQLKAGVQFDEADKNLMVGKIQSKLRELQGNYAKMDKTLLERNALGKIVYFMRKYFFPLFLRRFQTETFDVQAGKIKKGYYTSFVQDFIKDLIILRGNINKYWHLASETDKRAVKLVAFDTLYLTAFTLLVNLLLPGEDDDDKELGFVMGNIVYTLLRTKTELETFHPIMGFDDMIRTTTSISVATRTIDNARKTLTDFVKLLSNQESAFYKRDTGDFEKGTPKVVSDIIKITGLPNQVYKLYNPDNTLKNFQSFVGR